MAKRANRSNARDGVDSIGRAHWRNAEARAERQWGDCQAAGAGVLAGSKMRHDGAPWWVQGRGTMPFGSRSAHRRATGRHAPRFHSRRSAADLRHTGYLARDSASKDGELGTFFDATRQVGWSIRDTGMGGGADR